MQFVFAGHTLDTDRRELRRGGDAIAVEPQVFDLLVYLVENRDRVVSKDDLIAAVWRNRIVSDSTLTSRINAARKALGDSGEEQKLIRTVPRKGLRFVGDVHMPSSVEQPGHRAAAGDENSEPRGALPLPDRPAIAVLPFINMSGEAEQEYFSDGITEDIITLLSKHRSLLVTARNSAFAFKGHGSDVRRMGTELCADYIVEGSVRKIGRTVRITVHLIETEGGRLVWADQYDRDLEEIFELQDEITKAIAARIEPSVSAAERLRAERKPHKHCKPGTSSISD